MQRGLVREMLAEFLGTFVLIVFGCGVVAQFVLSNGTAGSALSINIAWGLAVTMGCYVSAGVTGAPSIRRSRWRWPCTAGCRGARSCRIRWRSWRVRSWRR